MPEKQTTSNTTIVTTSSALLPECSAGLVSSLHVEIIDEDLDVQEDGGTIYLARNKNLLQEPKVRVRTISPTTGVETLLFETADYTVNHVAGEVTLAASTPDIVRVDYFYKPLDDAALSNLLAQCLNEIAVLIHRKIDENSIPADYKPAICKRFYTNVLKNLMMETRDYFAIGIAGRSISKDQVPAHFELTIKTNEAQLQNDINQLRNWNQTNRLS